MSGTEGRKFDSVSEPESRSTISAADAGSVDATEMDRVRALINEIVNAMIRRAARDNITEDKLKQVYRSCFEAKPPAMRPNKTAAYDRLFGFGENGRAYLPRSDARVAPLSNVQPNHINCIKAALSHLGIIERAPAFGKEPSSWLSFLKYALSSVEQRTRSVDESDQTAVASAPTGPASQAPVSNRAPERSHPVAAGAESGSKPSSAESEVKATVKSISFALPRQRIAAAIATLFVVGTAAVTVSKLPSRAPRLPTNQIAEASAALPSVEKPLAQADGIGSSAFIDPKILLGPNAGSSQANVGVTATDPRLEEAARLRAEGNVAEADRLTQTVADEWAKARTVSNKNEAQAHRQLGASAYFLKNYDGSIEEYTKATKIDPTAADYHEIGSAYHAKFDYDHALTNYSEAIRLEPKTFAWPYNNRGNVFQDRPIPDLERAISDYNVAIQIDPNLVSALNNRGNAFHTRGDEDAATADYNRAIELKPDYAYPYNGRANVYYAKGDLARAISDYTEAIRLKPDYAIAWVNRGYAYYVAFDFKHAISDLSEAVKILSNTPDLDKTLTARAYAGRGAAYNVLVKPYDAIPDFQEAIRLNPAMSLAYAGLGSAYANIDKMDEAFENFRIAIERDPKAPYTYMIRGGFYLAKGDLSHAVADIEELIKIAPDEPWGYLTRGMVRLVQGDIDGAIVDLEAATSRGHNLIASSMAETVKSLQANDYDRALESIKPIFSSSEGNNLIILAAAYSMRASIYSAKGDLDRAIADVSDALKINPRNVSLYGVRAELYARKSEPKRALADYDKAVEYAPRSVSTYIARGNFLHDQHEDVRAVQDFERVIDLDPTTRQLAIVYFNLGIIHSEKNADQAMIDYGKVIESAVVPLNIKALINHAALLEKKSDFAGAIADYDQLLKLAPQFADVYGSRARAYRALGKFNESLSDYTVQIARNPRDARAYDNRGDTYYVLGQYDLAIADYSVAIDADKEFSYAYFDRGKAYEAKQETDLAIKDYVEAIKHSPSISRAVLRLYVARTRAGDKSALKELEENADKLDRSDPLHRVIELFLGRRTADAVLGDAGADLCEMQLYTANWLMLHEDNKRGRQMLNEALTLCSKAEIPYYDAKIALAQLR